MVPVVVLFWQRRSWAATAITLGLSAVWVLLPFINRGVFDLPLYVYWLQAMTKHPIRGVDIGINSVFALLMALPLLGLWSLVRRSATQHSELSRGCMSLWVSMGIICIIGAKVGAGPQYLLPYIPVIAYLSGRAVQHIQQHDLRPAHRLLGPRYVALYGGTWTILCAILAFNGQQDLITFVRDRQGQTIQSDLNAVRARYQDNTIQMGYGDDPSYRATFFRPLLYQGPTEYALDAPSVSDMQISGIPLNAALIDVFAKQTFDIWLIPRSDAPFSMASDSPGASMLFDVQLRSAFESHYQKISTSAFYDVWQARRLAP